MLDSDNYAKSKMENFLVSEQSWSFWVLQLYLYF